MKQTLIISNRIIHFWPYTWRIWLSGVLQSPYFQDICLQSWLNVSQNGQKWWKSSKSPKIKPAFLPHCEFLGFSFNLYVMEDSW